MKLKTLKDLEKDYEWKWDTYNALKQEAIKHIKEWEKKIFSQREINSIVNDNNVKRFEFMNFFNISEEDLKEK